MKIIQLRCGSCGGMLNIDEDKANTTLFCPYCGQRTMMVESDDVKINKMKYDAEKESYRHQADKDYYEYLKEKEKQETKRKADINEFRILIAMFIFIIVYFLFVL